MSEVETKEIDIHDLFFEPSLQVSDIQEGCLCFRCCAVNEIRNQDNGQIYTYPVTTSHDMIHATIFIKQVCTSLA